MNNLPKPKSIDPGLEKLQKACAEFLEFVQHGDDDSGDFESQIFEAALEAIYGENIFDWVNEQLLKDLKTNGESNS